MHHALIDGVSGARMMAKSLSLTAAEHKPPMWAQDLLHHGTPRAKGAQPNLLEQLSKPYAYDLRRLYYDWAERYWRLLPDPLAHPEATFADWLHSLVKQRDVDSLTGILELVQDALSRVRVETAQGELDRPG